MPAIGSPNESYVCVFGTDFCWRAQARFVNDRGALVSCFYTGYCAALTMGVPTFMFPQRDLAIQYLPGYDTFMRAEARGGILFPLLQLVYGFVCVVKMLDMDGGIQFPSCHF